jgi:hypothetical protein
LPHNHHALCSMVVLLVYDAAHPIDRVYCRSTGRTANLGMVYKRKPPDHAPESGTHEPGRKADRTGPGSPAEARGPTGKATTGSSRPTASAREAHEPDPNPEKHAEGEGQETRPAGQGEETNPTKPRPAPEAATAETSDE